MAAGADESNVIVDDAYPEKVPVPGVMKLLSDLADTLNEPGSSDVTFICKDGEKLHASLWFLSLRCSFFKAMFGHEMVGSKESEVPLLQFSSSTMLCILEYLYTGEIRCHPPLSWKMGFEIISASHFFMIPEVEAVAQEFLRKVLSNVPRTDDLVITMLNEALEFQEAWEWKRSLLLELLSEFFIYWLVLEDVAPKLSETTIGFLLAERKGDWCSGGEQQSVGEYYALRQIVQWQAAQTLLVNETRAQEILDDALPIGVDAPTLWSTIFDYPLNAEGFPCLSSNRPDAGDTTLVLTRLGVDASEESFQRLLSHICWVRIPAMLLLKVVYPFGIISPPDLFRALAFQALHKHTEHYPLSAENWQHNDCKSLTTDYDTLVCKSSDGLRSGSGIAIPGLPMPRSYDVYEWHFEIEENDVDYIALGIICATGSDPWREHDLGKRDLFSCSAARLLCIDFGTGSTYVGGKNPEIKTCEKWEKFSTVPEKGSPIKFTLDASEKTCRVSFGDTFPTMWKDLSDGVYYPVIQVIDAKLVSVRVEALTGFDFL